MFCHLCEKLIYESKKEDWIPTGENWSPLVSIVHYPNQWSTTRLDFHVECFRDAAGEGFLPVGCGADNNICCGIPVTPHPCPFLVESRDDHSLCDCCPDCEQQCADDI